RHPQEGEPLVEVPPQVRRQALVGRVRLRREGEVGQPVNQVAATHGQPVVADLTGCVAVAQVEPGPQQCAYPTGKTYRPAGRGLQQVATAPQRVHHPNAIAELRATLVIPYTSTARPYRPRRPSTS